MNYFLIDPNRHHAGHYPIRQKRRVKGVIAALAVFTMFRAYGAPATLEQQIDPPAIHLGDTAKISITVKDGGWTRLLQLPKVTDATVLRLGQEDIEGTQEHPIVISRFAIMPSHTGEFTIPGFDVKTQDREILHVQPMTVEVFDVGQNIPAKYLQQASHFAPASSPSRPTSNDEALTVYTESKPAQVIHFGPDGKPLPPTALTDTNATSSTVSPESSLNVRVDNKLKNTVGKETEPLSRLIEEANRGDADAEGELGVRYNIGNQIPQDYAQAFNWYKKAADQGNVLGEIGLGALYVEGKGAPLDEAQAYYWYKKAADQGDTSGEVQLGLFYEGGLGVPQDYTRAYAWLKKAADQGDSEAAAMIVKLAASSPSPISTDLQAKPALTTFTKPQSAPSQSAATVSPKVTTTTPESSAVPATNPQPVVVEARGKVLQLVDHGYLIAAQLVTPTISFGVASVENTYYVSCDKPTLVDNDPFDAMVCITSDAYRYETAQGAGATVRVLSFATQQQISDLQAKLDRERATAEDEREEIVWAMIPEHQWNVEYVLKAKFAEPLKSVSGRLTGPLTPDMILRVQHGDLSAVDGISKNLNSTDKAVLLAALQHAKRV